MAYNALQTIREQNRKKYGAKAGPIIPALATKEKQGSLAWCALKFLRDMCEDLRFDTAPNKFDALQMEKILLYKDHYGSSYSANQIPYYMQMDLDRLCLEQTLGKFLYSGTTHAAFHVYYCYLEMFMGDEAGDVRRMIELLSEFEKNASPLIYSHRDHFSHSVYVFALGLAVFQQSSLFRSAYSKRNGIKSTKQAAHHFLKYWGFSALFHDLGYPFELAYRQVSAYFAEQKIPSFYISYQKIVPNPKDKKKANETFEEEYHSLYKALFPTDLGFEASPTTANELFAGALTNILYPTFKNCRNYQKSLKSKTDDSCHSFYQYLVHVFEKKPNDPRFFNDNIDHAYFSAYTVLHQMWKPSKKYLPEKDYIDAITAILLHNSLLRYSLLKDEDGIGSGLSLKMETHPLAYLLILCDEIQCWNRFGYGRGTRKENHPLGCDFSFTGDEITAIYHFDDERREEITGTYKKFCGRRNPYNYIMELQSFLDINHDGTSLRLTVGFDCVKRLAMHGETLSECSFLNTYLLATQLNAEYQLRQEYNDLHPTEPHLPNEPSKVEREALFEPLSLEYKLANFYQVQHFAEHLDKIGCFFTDRPVDFHELDRFDEVQLKRIGKWEHKAWALRKRELGWRFGRTYRIASLQETEQNNLRERLREHEYLGVPFLNLPPDKQEKDMMPIVKFKYYMKKNYQIRIYKL